MFSTIVEILEDKEEATTLPYKNHQSYRFELRPIVIAKVKASIAASFGSTFGSHPPIPAFY
jgi:hypothetical protein